MLAKLLHADAPFHLAAPAVARGYVGRLISVDGFLQDTTSAMQELQKELDTAWKDMMEVADGQHPPEPDLSVDDLLEPEVYSFLHAPLPPPAPLPQTWPTNPAAVAANHSGGGGNLVTHQQHTAASAHSTAPRGSTVEEGGDGTGDERSRSYGEGSRGPTASLVAHLHVRQELRGRLAEAMQRLDSLAGFQPVPPGRRPPAGWLGPVLSGFPTAEGSAPGDASAAPADGDVILTLVIGLPALPGRPQQAVKVLGRQSLSVLLDVLTCPVDGMVAPQLGPSKGAYMFVEDTFYCDSSVPGWREAPQGVMAFCERQGLQAPLLLPLSGGLRPGQSGRQHEGDSLEEGDRGPVGPAGLRVASLSGTTFRDLSVRCGSASPYLLVHRGGCEHTVRVADMHLAGKKDGPASVYPLVVYYSPMARGASCSVCGSCLVSKVVLDDWRAPSNPGVYCTHCFAMAHCDSKGRLLREDLQCHDVSANAASPFAPRFSQGLGTGGGLAGH